MGNITVTVKPSFRKYLHKYNETYTEKLRTHKFQPRILHSYFGIYSSDVTRLQTATKLNQSNSFKTHIDLEHSQNTSEPKCFLTSEPFPRWFMQVSGDIMHWDAIWPLFRTQNWIINISNIKLYGIIENSFRPTKFSTQAIYSKTRWH